MGLISRKKKNIAKVLISIFAVAISNYFYPVIRLESKVLNIVFMILILFIPAVITLLALYLDKDYKKVAIIISGSIISFIAFLFILTAIADLDNVINTGNYKSSEQIKYYRTEHFKLSTYKIDGNMLFDPRIVVRQEKELLFGVVLVREIFSEYNRLSVNIEMDSNLLTIDSYKYLLKKSLYMN